MGNVAGGLGTAIQPAGYTGHSEVGSPAHHPCGWRAELSDSRRSQCGEPCARGNAANIVGGAVGSTALDVGSAVGRGVNQFSAAQSFSAGGGAEFLAAARASGSPVSRLGYGAIAAIGCGGGALVVFMVVVITLFSLGL